MNTYHRIAAFVSSLRVETVLFVMFLAFALGAYLKPETIAWTL